MAIPLYCQVFVQYFLLSSQNIIINYLCNNVHTIDTSEGDRMMSVFESESNVAVLFSILATILMLSVF